MFSLSKKDDNSIEEKEQIYLFKKISKVDKYNFYDYMGTMIDGGVSISDALEMSIGKIKRPYFASKVAQLKVFIDGGDSFSRAMKKVPSGFDISEIAIIEAGEVTGNLGNAFSLLSEDLKRVNNLNSKIKGSLTYPIIIMLFLVIALVVILTYVIPNLVGVFAENKAELPRSTQMLIDLSDFVVYKYHLIIIFVVAVTMGFIGYKNTDSGKITLANLVLNMPVVGDVYRNYILTIFSSNFGTLINSGVSVIKSLTLTAKTVDNYQYELLIQNMIMRVSKGEKITESMENADKDNFYFPKDFVQLFSVGEKTASIGEISKKISNQYILEVDNSLANLTKWIEPVALLFAGIFVLWFAVAILGATLSLTQSFS